MSANWGGVNMRMSCMAVVSGQLGSITSLATEITSGEILAAFFGPKMASEAISECLI